MSHHRTHLDYSEEDPTNNFESSTSFPYHELDGEEEPMTEERLATQSLTQMLQWFLGFCFYSRTGKTKPTTVAYKRLLALTFILRPDLLGGATLDDLTAELGESRNALSRWTAELTYMFGEQGINQQTLEKKIKHHFDSLAKFDAERANKPVTIEEWIRTMPKREEARSVS